jgi:hypothetical protein
VGDDDKGTGGTIVQNRLKDLILGHDDDDNDDNAYDNEHNKYDDNVYENNDDLNLSWSNSKLEKLHNEKLHNHHFSTNTVGR